jgi:hypothetical protein
MKNAAALWRLELDALLEAEASTRSPADRRKALGEIAATMRRNPKLIAGLRAEGRPLLDARAAVLVAVERLAVVFPDREAEEAFESALAAALTWCLDLEARAKAGDTPKKEREAIPRGPDNRDFLDSLKRLNRPIENFEAEAHKWWCKQNGKKAEALTKGDKGKIKALARSALRAFKKER